jgi:hypothetical protein
MGIRETVVVEATCDICDKVIDTSKMFIDASYYGRALHISCFQDTTPFFLVQLLDIGDTVTLKTPNGVRLPMSKDNWVVAIDSGD